MFLKAGYKNGFALVPFSLMFCEILVAIPAKTITVHLKAREIELPDNFHSLGGIARAKKLSPERRKEIYVNDCFGDFTQEDVLKVCKTFKNGKIYTEF